MKRFDCSKKITVVNVCKDRHPVMEGKIFCLGLQAYWDGFGHGFRQEVGSHMVV